MENPVAMTHLSHPQIPQMKSYLDATATTAFPRLDQTETLLHPVSQIRGINTSLRWYAKYLICYKPHNQGWC